METDDKKIVCVSCSKEKESADIVVCDDEDVCKDCFSDNGFTCEDCDEPHLSDNVDSYETNNGDIICEYCFEEHYYRCDDCEGIFNGDNTSYCNYHDRHFCDGCFDDNGHGDNCGGNDISAEQIERDPKFSKEHTSAENGKIIKSARLFGVEIESITDAITQRSELTSFEKLLPKNVGVCDDGSLDCSREEVSMEFQTPPASGKAGEQLLISTCTALSKYDFRVNNSCGLHVHIDGNDFVSEEKPLYNAHLENADELQQEVNPRPRIGRPTITEQRQREMRARNRLAALKSLFMFYVAFEDVIVSFLPVSRRLNRYCKLIHTEMSLRSIERCDDENGLTALWYGTDNIGDINDRKRNKYDDSRYYGVNFHSLFSAGHLEIRYHSGTVQAEKILRWANLHLRIVDKAATLNLPYHIGEYAAVSAQSSLVEKAKKMFDLLQLDNDSREYFSKRMRKFNFGRSYRAEEEE